MAVPTVVSLTLSSVLSVSLFAFMQMYKPFLASTQPATILGGFLASWLFLFSLTAISNFESVLFDKGFQAKIFPEVFVCLLTAVVAAGMVHRVCVTTCIIFSLIGLYFVNRVSQSANSLAPPTTDTKQLKKKKK